ncbi:hypothetical protein DRP04_01750 [Archaeoglobales archaeon]|nr:MAG: hypothetical protein DRP04_01750 [Archaeoglobales archaeon]
MSAYPIFTKTTLFVNGKLVKEKIKKEIFSEVKCSEGDEIMWKGTIKNIGDEGLIMIQYSDYHKDRRKFVYWDRDTVRLKAGEEFEIAHKWRIKGGGTHHLYFVLFFWTGKTWAAPSRTRYWTSDSYKAEVKAAKPPVKPPVKPPEKIAVRTLTQFWGKMGWLTVGIQANYDVRTRKIAGTAYQEFRRGPPALIDVYIVLNPYSKAELESDKLKEFSVIHHLRPRITGTTTIKGKRYGIYSFTATLPEGINPKAVIAIRAVTSGGAYSPLLFAQPNIVSMTAPKIACADSRQTVVVEVKNDGTKTARGTVRLYVNNRVADSVSGEFEPDKIKRVELGFTMPRKTSQLRVTFSLERQMVSKSTMTDVKFPSISITAAAPDKARPGDEYTVTTFLRCEDCPTTVRVSNVQNGRTLETKTLSMLVNERKTVKFKSKMQSKAYGTTHTIIARTPYRSHSKSLKILPVECCIFDGRYIQVWAPRDSTVEFIGIINGSADGARNVDIYGKNTYLVKGKAAPNDFAELVGNFDSVTLSFSIPLTIAFGSNIKRGRSVIKSRVPPAFIVLKDPIEKEKLELVYNKLQRVPVILRPVTFPAVVMSELWG